MRKTFWAGLLLTGLNGLGIPAFADNSIGSTTLSGMLFTDWTYLNQQQNGVGTIATGYGIRYQAFLSGGGSRL